MASTRAKEPKDTTASSRRTAAKVQEGADQRLEQYRSMRRKPTPEPSANALRKRRGHRPIFVIQEHRARALHWDFRLERDGVLVSWAVPKGLPIDHKTTRLAIHTEDHPLEYATFSGSIPRGSYGAGEVEIYDSGTYDTERFDEKEVKVSLHGSRIQGRYALIQTKDDQWIVKRLDSDEGSLDAMPESLEPMLALAGPLPADDGKWAYEFKWDGVRALAFVDGGRMQLQSRSRRTITAAYPELREVGAAVGPHRAILDGEIVALDANGRPSFEALQPRMHLADPRRIRDVMMRTPVSYLIFDLCYLDGHLLMDLAWHERRRLLEALEITGEHVAVPPLAPAPATAAQQAAREAGLEGIVAKRIESKYRPGRRDGNWVKIKNFRAQEVVIAGYTAGNGRRAKQIGALVLGVYDGEDLSYVGQVGTGFSDEALEDLQQSLQPLRQSESPFKQPLPARDRAGVFWTRPDLVGEVSFVEWTKADRLRAPSWRGIREDKSARQVHREP